MEYINIIIYLTPNHQIIDFLYQELDFHGGKSNQVKQMNGTLKKVAN
jgi:hypothetical protein